MADTHINAYFGAVDEAYKEVLAAHGKYDAAKTALETKKKEVGYEEPQTAPTQQVPTVVEDPKKKK